MNGQLAALRVAIEASRFRIGPLDRFWKLGVAAGVAIAVGLGLFGRLHGLGDFPLAVDEYYFIQSVKAILAHGVPSHDTGGYYTRGLLLQYLTAACVLLFGDGGFAYRLPAAVFSLGTVPLAYLYGKRLLGTTGAAALAVLLLISAWEIEFGRFARMYSGIQFFTLGFFVALDRAVEGRRWLYLPHAIVLVALFVHESAILLVPFLFVPALSLKNDRQQTLARQRLRFALVSSVVTLLCYKMYTSFDAIGFGGVSNNLPADFVATPGRSQWLLPVLPFFDASYSQILLSLGFGLAAAMVCVFLMLRVLGRSAAEGHLFGGLLFVSVALHQFLVAGVIVLVMAARHRTIDFGSRRLQAMLALAIGLAVFWLAYAMRSQEWIANTFRPEYGFSPDYGIVKALIRTFFGWPVIIDSVVLPWLDGLPLVGGCAIAAGVYQLATKADAGIISWARSPVIILATVFLVFGLHVTPYTSIRYSFFIYPFVLALILLSAVEAAAAMARRIRMDERLGTVIGVLVSLVLFVASSDFHLRQITAVAGPSVRLRLGEFERYESIWYPRWDYETPAIFINERAGLRDGDKVVAVEHQPLSFYLRVSHAVYIARSRFIFYDHSRAGGTIDRWSNQRLLSTPQELQNYTACAGNVWIVRNVSSERRPFEIGDVWRERLVKSAEVFRSVDDRLAVVRVELEPAKGCSL